MTEATATQGTIVKLRVTRTVVEDITVRLFAEEMSGMAKELDCLGLIETEVNTGEKKTFLEYDENGDFDHPDESTAIGEVIETTEVMTSTDFEASETA